MSIKLLVSCNKQVILNSLKDIIKTTKLQLFNTKLI